MFRLTIKNLLDKKIRFFLTTFAVVVGVSMVVGVFGLTDSLRSSFEGLAEDIAEGSDLTVRSQQEIGDDFDRAPVPETVETLVRDVDGVARTLPGVFSFNTVITDSDGNPIIPAGAPAIGFNYSPVQFFIQQGIEPTKAGQFATDATTARNNGLVVGETYAISGPIEQADFELVGIFNFGSADGNTSLGQTMTAFELVQAQSFLGFGTTYAEIGIVVDEGANVASVQAAVQEAIGRDFEVLTQKVIRDEQTNDFNEVINIFNWVLLVFAFIIVFVSAFIINNTFQIVVAQRIRELGLLRAIGATGRQVSNSVLLEAALVGVFSTIAGLLIGRLISSGLRGALNGLGFSLPAGEIRIEPRTIVWAAAIGIGVTMLSSIIPARRARTISPIAAIQADHSLAGTSLRRRLIVGSVVTSVGATFLILGLFAGFATVPTLGCVGVGAFTVFIGVNTLAPSFARPLANLLGRPIAKVFGVAGQLAQGNAARSPRRTASTAGALMIGLALVGMAGVVGASLTQTFRDTFDGSVNADYFVQTPGASFDPSAGFSTEVADELEALDELNSVVRYRFAIGSIRVDGENKDIFTSDFDRVEAHMDGDIVAGGLTDADPASSIALHSDPAADLAVEVGDTINVTFPDNETETLTVAAIYDDSTLFGNWMIDNVLWDAHFNRRAIAFASATITGLSDDMADYERKPLLDATEAAVENVADRYPAVEIESRVEFRAGQEAQLTSFLAVIQILLLVSLIIALVGITNTLALSVFERTREIGLLRAVGMSRRQLRRAIRWEAVIIAVFGALLGLTLGVIFGVAAVIAIPDSFIKTVSIPYGSLVVYVVIAAIAGILAAILPARRAGRLNILDAISHE